MKKMKTGVVLLALLLAGMAMVPMVNALEQSVQTKMIQVDPKTDTQGFVAVDVINIDPAIKVATPYYGMLVLSDEGKQNFLKALDATSVTAGSGALITSDSKSDIRNNVSALWKKYPVISETKKGDKGYPSYGGTITTIKFASNVGSVKLTDQENQILDKSNSLLTGKSGQIQAQTISPMWIGTPTHSRISYWAAYKESFPYPNTVSANAPAPDNWYDNSPEPFKTLFHGYNHYYNPLTGIGAAPSNTASNVATAKSYYRQGSGSYSTAAVYLGYSSHFLEDVGNPMHTGNEGQQWLYPWTHSNYETYVGNHWTATFESTMANNYNYYWYTDWNQGTRDLASYSNGYLDTLWTQVYNKGQSWNLNSDPNIDALTQNLILRTAKETNGLALYARIG